MLARHVSMDSTLIKQQVNVINVMFKIQDAILVLMVQVALLAMKVSIKIRKRHVLLAIKSILTV